MEKENPNLSVCLDLHIRSYGLSASRCHLFSIREVLIHVTVIPSLLLSFSLKSHFTS